VRLLVAAAVVWGLVSLWSPPPPVTYLDDSGALVTRSRIVR
jgi:hypothetical protein